MQILDETMLQYNIRTNIIIKSFTGKKNEMKKTNAPDALVDFIAKFNMLQLHLQVNQSINQSHFIFIAHIHKSQFVS